MICRSLPLILLSGLVFALQPAAALTYTEDFSSGLGNWALEPGSSPGSSISHDAGNEWAQSNAPFSFPPFEAHVRNVTDTFDITGAGDVLTFDVDFDVLDGTAPHYVEFHLVDITLAFGAGFRYNVGTGDITQLMGGSATGNVGAHTPGTFQTASLELSYDGVNITPTFILAGGTVVGDSSALTAPETFHARFGFATIQEAYIDNVAITLVPEPSTAILVMGGVGLLFLRRRRRG